MEIISHVSSIDTPGTYRWTKKVPICSSSVTQAVTRKISRTGESVVNVLRPLSIHLSPFLRAVVSGRPPRVGLPVPASDAAVLTRAPLDISSKNSSMTSFFHGLFSVKDKTVPTCQPIPKAVGPQYSAIFSWAKRKSYKEPPCPPNSLANVNVG